MYDECAKESIAGPLRGVNSNNRPSIPEQLKSRKKRCEDELKEINQAIELFEKYPEMAEAISLVRNIC